MRFYMIITVFRYLMWDSDPLVYPSHRSWSLRDGLQGKVAVKKPLLRKWNKGKRMRYAQEYENWTEYQWQQIQWAMNPPWNLDLSVSDAAWDHLGKEQNKKSANIQRRASKSPGKLFRCSGNRNEKKACQFVFPFEFKHDSVTFSALILHFPDNMGSENSDTTVKQMVIVTI